MAPYYNPIYSKGVDTFLEAAKKAGATGLIVVDLPARETNERCLPRKAPNEFYPLGTADT